MTSKLKCPICGGDIQYNDGYSTYDCKNNPANHNASEEIWQALIQAKQDLEIATNALREICNDYQEDSTERAEKALTQIEHKE